MTTRTSIQSANNNAKSDNNWIQPFEWLTSPESIGRFVREHVLERGNCHDGVSWKAMNIGCGSSTVGEYLVQELGFGKVANVDRDRETLEGMEHRWRELGNNDDDDENRQQLDEDHRIRTATTSTIIPSTTNQKMEYWCLDYTQERLPVDYEGIFDLVVDKSTLDCTLCSDCSSTASFLMEIYRTLAAKSGVYLLISFHKLELVLPLIEDLPGAKWTVTHTTMERQVECVADNAKGYGNTISNNESVKEDGNSKKHDGTAVTEPVLLEDDERKPLNVLIARRFVDPEDSSAVLDFDAVVRHVQEVNDRWFQEEQPLLTEERILELKRAFGYSDDEKKEDGELGATTMTTTFSLEQAYKIMFTEAEREHLTYEHFMEDWEAFCCEENGGLLRCTGQCGHDLPACRQTVTFELALSFLEANQ